MLRTLMGVPVGVKKASGAMNNTALSFPPLEAFCRVSPSIIVLTIILAHRQSYRKKMYSLEKRRY
jgi:hypothetical protein